MKQLLDEYGVVNFHEAFVYFLDYGDVSLTHRHNNVVSLPQLLTLTEVVTPTCAYQYYQYKY